MSVNPTEIEKGLLKQLLSKAIPEKEKAWELVYKAYYPVIYDYVLKTGGVDEDATDIFQDGLMVLHRNLNNGMFREESSIKTYLFSICRNLWHKELSRRQKQLLTAEDLIVVTSQDLNYLINAELVTLLMNELKADCRNILTEYYFNKKSMAELKEIFNVNSIQAAKNKKMRCLSYLVKLVKEKGITSAWDR